MVLYALSLQGQVEKYGSYVGIAAFFGLAVLSLLYFAQAREGKRLREWAGRAPQRARELEERALAAAEEARPPPPGPPRAPPPAAGGHPAAEPGAQPQSEVAPAAAAPAATTAGARSGGVGPAVAVAAAGSAVAEQERPVGGEGDEPVAAGPVTEDGKRPAPALPRRSDADDPELAERDDEDPRDEAEDADPDDDTGAEAAERPAAAPTNGTPP